MRRSRHTSRPRTETDPAAPAVAAAAGESDPPDHPETVGTVTTAGTASRGRTGRDIVFQLLLRMANLVLGLGTTVIFVRALGTAGFGQWATVYAILGLAGSFGIRGLNNVAVERAAGDPPRAADWVGALVSLRVTLSPPLTLASLGICFLLVDSTEMRIMALIVHTTLLTSSMGAARVVFQLQVRNSRVSAIELANGIGWGLAVVVVAALGGGLVAFALAMATVTHITNLLLVWLAFRAHPITLRGSRRYWRELLRLGLPVGLTTLITISYGRVDAVLVFELAGADDAGLYSAVYRIYERLSFFPSTLMLTLFPIIVAARDQSRERLKRIFNTAIDYLVLVSLPALTITLAGPEPLTRLLFGDEFAAAAPALVILMASAIFVALGHLSGYLVITYELQRVYVFAALGALVFNVSANLLLVPSYGFVAAAWVTLATEALIVSVALGMVSRRMGVAPTGVRFARIVLAAVGAGLVAYGLRKLGAPVLAWSGAAVAAYPVLVLAVGAIRIAEIRPLLRRDG